MLARQGSMLTLGPLGSDVYFRLSRSPVYLYVPSAPSKRIRSSDHQLAIECVYFVTNNLQCLTTAVMPHRVGG